MAETSQNTHPAPVRWLENLGRKSVAAVEAVGFAAAMAGECIYWLFVGRRQGQPVRMSSVAVQMIEIGVSAIPIVALMSATIGVMLAIQGIHTLKIFGAESQVAIGIAFSMVREFGPLITGILVAGRSGAALAARIGTMKINQEIDALNVMGVNPVRYLAAPALIGMLIALPCLTLFAMVTGLAGGGFYINLDLSISYAAYADRVVAVLRLEDLTHGLGKSALFAVLIAVIGVANGASVTGGAEGVGKVTTRAVVQSICAIIITDMVFAFAVTR
ncbi:MAG: MlaE family ABC transporter permease [Rhodospirillales bacterium]